VPAKNRQQPESIRPPGARPGGAPDVTTVLLKEASGFPGTKATRRASESWTNDGTVAPAGFATDNGGVVEQPTEVVVRVDAGADGDEEEVAELALRLRDELHEVDGASVRLAREAPAPAGAKGAAVEWGTLLVGVVSSGALTALITTASSWLGRQRGGSVRVRIGDDELELTGATSEEQRRLVDAWLARRAGE
jgi:hypothetical protein